MTGGQPHPPPRCVEGLRSRRLLRGSPLQRRPSVVVRAGSAPSPRIAEKHLRGFRSPHSGSLRQAPPPPLRFGGAARGCFAKTTARADGRTPARNDGQAGRPRRPASQARGISAPLQLAGSPSSIPERSEGVARRMATRPGKLPPPLCFGGAARGCFANTTTRASQSASAFRFAL